MSDAPTFDPIWENDIYGQGQQFNRYPYDFVVSFVFKYALRDKPRHEVRILEIGCGAGNNLWFAAREGFKVAGIDGSESAINYARQRFDEEGLSGDLRVGDFTTLPFEDESFDLAIDRGALVCVGRSAGHQAVGEIRRVLRPGGLFLFNPYSKEHTSYTSGAPGPDGLILNITAGRLTGNGQLCFYDRANVETIFAEGWRILNFDHVVSVNHTKPGEDIHAEWRVVAQKMVETVT